MTDQDIIALLKDKLTVEAELKKGGRYSSGPTLTLTVRFGDEEISKTEQMIWYGDLREDRDRDY